MQKMTNAEFVMKVKVDLGLGAKWMLMVTLMMIKMKKET